VHSYSGRGGTTYRAEIIYSYHVGSEYYSGCYKGDLCSSEAEADGLIQQYPKGTTIQIRVHSRKPELSVLGP
jgi:hypothetical protein